ncbi:MAG: PQQ-binding-like beta-propeller repeat protein [Planctomyces sp.]|nr:PQQ-binding-like beta-propeller repeat protein [Planctomyces sp.]
MMKRSLLLAMSCVCSLVFSAPLLAADADPLDWPYWRGARFDGTSPEKGLPDEWNPEGGEGSNLLWKAPFGSRSTPVLMAGKLYLITTDKPEVPTEEREKVVCLDAQTGEVKWERAFNVYLTDVPRERLGWSSVVADPASGNVFVLGVAANFLCLNGDTGEVVWERSLFEEYGFLTTYGGRTNFPIVHEDNVIISAVVIGWDEMAKPAHRFIAFHKSNGQPVWFQSTRLLPEDTTYSAPVLSVVNGQLQLVVGAGDGSMYGIQPRTGKKIWQYDVSSHGLNVSPLVVDGRVYCGHSEENQDSNESGAVFCLDATKTGNITKDGEFWRQTELMVGRASPLMHGGRLYVASDTGKLFTLDPETGKVLDRKTMGTMVRASPLFVDGKLYMNEVSRGCYVYRPTEKGLEQVSRVRLPSGEECHGSPICSHGRIYLPSTGAMYCIGFAEWSKEVDELPEPARESPREEDEAPAQVQVVPVETQLPPGARQTYHVRLYNDRGQYLRLAAAGDVEFTATGPATIDAEGVLTVPKDLSAAGAALVTAKVGEHSGGARVRLFPRLPWSFDFNDGEVPITWVGAQYRHVVIDFDLWQKLRQQDERAAAMYLYLYTNIRNAPKPELVIDDSTPQEKWKEFLAYLKLATDESRPRTKADAEALLGPSLKLLQDEKVFDVVEWSTWDRPTGAEGATVAEPRLRITKGERGVSGEGVLCKLMTIPKGSRSQGTIGPDDMRNYTFQADVYGLERDGKVGDVGIIAQRYACVLMGAHQRLEIRTWHTQPERFSAEYPFAWSPDTWYTIKFQASTEGDKAVLKAKVWKRGEPEPSNWMVTGEDSVPNLQGSPGLFGDAKVAEFFYDNISVAPNDG